MCMELLEEVGVGVVLKGNVLYMHNRLIQVIQVITEGA